MKSSCQFLRKQLLNWLSLQGVELLAAVVLEVSHSDHVISLLSAMVDPKTSNSYKPSTHLGNHYSDKWQVFKQKRIEGLHKQAKKEGTLTSESSQYSALNTVEGALPLYKGPEWPLVNNGWLIG